MTSAESEHNGHHSTAYKVARCLGYASIAIGLIELVWADSLAMNLGLSRFEWLVRAYGVREVLTGVLILVSKDPTPWIWLRVIGDAVDGATLGWGYMRDPFKMMGIMTCFMTVTPVIIADVWCALKLSSSKSKS